MIPATPAIGFLARAADEKTMKAFTPALTAAPSDWTMYINYTGGGMNTPTAVAVDAIGNVWVASYHGVASEFSSAIAILQFVAAEL